MDTMISNKVMFDHEVSKVELAVGDKRIGQIIRTSPAAGVRVDGHQTLIFYLGVDPSGQYPSTLAMPDVVGLSNLQARNQLGDAGFNVVESFVAYTEGVAPGTAVSQSPSAGQTVSRDDSVRLNIASTLRSYTVEDFAGKTLRQAELSIAANKFQYRRAVTTVELPAGDPMIGKVIRTDPAAGNILPEGGTLTFYIGGETS